jgi:hypothetical protein
VSTQALPHLVEPPTQVRPHWPLEQTSPAAQAWLQTPQLAGSFAASTHKAPHRVEPPAQSSAHCPAEQTSPAAHATPQEPQW